MMPVPSYVLILQRGPGRLWGGLIIQSPPLWLKHATPVLSLDKYKWSRRKLNASFSAFVLDDFNTLTGNCQSKEVLLCWKATFLFSKCSLPWLWPLSMAFSVKFQLLILAQKSSCNLTTVYLSRITSCHSPMSPLFSSPTRLSAIP